MSGAIAETLGVNIGSLELAAENAGGQD